jgi:hypothetical protein
MSEQIGTTTTAPPVAPAKERATNGKAIGSLLMGVIGVTGFPFVASVVAVILGHMARKEMKTDGKQGQGLALTGIILGWIGITLVVLAALIFGWFITSLWGK